MTTPRRLFVVCDMAEEGWPSMDFAGEALVEGVAGHGDGSLTPVAIRPSMVRRFSVPGATGSRGYTADRLLNRFWDYPRRLRRLRVAGGPEDLFHIVDHSYAQLVHETPPARTVVTCHDADTFRCLTHPGDEPRSALFKRMTNRTLTGLQKAAVVCCVSEATRASLAEWRLVDLDKLVVIAQPVHPAFGARPDATADREACRLLSGAAPGVVDILHVGSTSSRKRIDVLLRAVAGIRRHVPAVRLLRVGGPFTPEQERLVGQLDLAPYILTLPMVDRRVLAAIYRRAAIVLLPSEREGFGFPVVESLASGTPIVASDIPVLRETGGDGATYCAVGDPSAWMETAMTLLAERQERPDAWVARRERGMTHAGRFTYSAYARQLTTVYSRLS